MRGPDRGRQFESLDRQRELLALMSVPIDRAKASFLCIALEQLDHTSESRMTHGRSNKRFAAPMVANPIVSQRT
jgi:hypothetical protein